MKQINIWEWPRKKKTTEEFCHSVEKQFKIDWIVSLLSCFGGKQTFKPFGKEFLFNIGKYVPRKVKNNLSGSFSVLFSHPQNFIEIFLLN